MTKVSVVIPSFNSQATIVQAVESVLAQSYTNFEVIFIDDGSTDQSIEVLKTIQDSRFFWVTQQNQGTGAARNHGVRLATGDLLCFLDADDVWAKDKLKFQLLDIQLAQMVFSNVQEFFDASIEVGGRPRVLPGYYASTMMVSKEDFLKVGLFDEHLAVAEFIDWLSRAKDYGLSSFLNERILAFRRIHRGNIGRLKIGRASCRERG